MTEATTHTGQTYETVLYTDFDIAYAINQYLIHLRRRNQMLEAAFNLPIKQTEHRRRQLTEITALINSERGKIILLTKMGLRFNTDGSLIGVEVDQNNLFVRFTMGSAV